MTPKFFINARIGEVSREFLGLRHLGAVVWQNKLQLHDALRTGDQDEKKAAPKSIVTPKDPPKVNIPNCELCAVWRALVPAKKIFRGENPNPFSAQFFHGLPSLAHTGCFGTGIATTPIYYTGGAERRRPFRDTPLGGGRRTSSIHPAQ